VGNPAGGIVLLLIALYLLLAFFGGRLEWLFRLGADVRGGSANAIGGLAGPTGVTPPPVALPRPTTTGRGRPAMAL
jgi:hypothetical protein